jgi:hypothetical protein
LESVQSDQNLIFNSPKGKEKFDYDYALVMPHMELPSFLRYSGLHKNLEIDKNSLKVTNTDSDDESEKSNVFILGDAMCDYEDFLNKFDTNIFHQAQVLSNNLKVSHFRLDKKQIRKYKPYGKVYFDFSKNEYVLIDTGIDDEMKSLSFLKKTFWNNFLFKHFYNRPEGGYAQKFLLEKKFGVKII